MTRPKRAPSWREWADRTRGKIQVTNIVTRLHKFIAASSEPVTCPECGHEFKNPVVMSQPQVKAAQVLLDKSLPTLTSADMNIREEPKDALDIYNALVAVLGKTKADMIMKDPSVGDEVEIEQAIEEAQDQPLQ